MNRGFRAPGARRMALASIGWALSGLLAGCRGPSTASAEPLRVSSGIDHAEWDRLLKTYVDQRGLVSYGLWKGSSGDLRALASYVERFNGPVPASGGGWAQGKEQAAALINAYNALTVGWVLANYPTKSVMALPESFKAARHRVGGRLVSLDTIEHESLRPLVGYRIHAALVCAARSCPPLAREAYRGERLDEQLDAAMARWLARDDLNHYLMAERTAQLSSIFKWYASDFEKPGGIRAVLARHAPPGVRPLAEAKALRIEYLPYDWSLNDRAGSPGT